MSLCGPLAHDSGIIAGAPVVRRRLVRRIADVFARLRLGDGREAEPGGGADEIAVEGGEVRAVR